MIAPFRYEGDGEDELVSRHHYLESVFFRKWPSYKTTEKLFFFIKPVKVPVNFSNILCCGSVNVHLVTKSSCLIEENKLCDDMSLTKLSSGVIPEILVICQSYFFFLLLLLFLA